jgi:hypothetical protein
VGSKAETTRLLLGNQDELPTTRTGLAILQTAKWHGAVRPGRAQMQVKKLLADCQ